MVDFLHLQLLHLHLEVEAFQLETCGQAIGTARPARTSIMRAEISATSVEFPNLKEWACRHLQRHLLAAIWVWDLHQDHLVWDHLVWLHQVHQVETTKI